MYRIQKRMEKPGVFMPWIVVLYRTFSCVIRKKKALSLSRTLTVQIVKASQYYQQMIKRIFHIFTRENVDGETISKEAKKCHSNLHIINQIK